MPIDEESHVSAAQAAHGPVQQRKKEVRRAALARRRLLSPVARDEADQAIAARVAALVRSLPAPRAGPVVVCAYRPMAAEPGGPYLLGALLGAGAQVLLPVVLPDLDLDWVRHDPDRLAAAAGLGREAIADAALVLVPALGVDWAGVRIGRGGGSYDRALTRVGPGTPVVAVLYDDERVDSLPTEDHDRPVTAVLTPSGLDPR